VAAESSRHKIFACRDCIAASLDAMDDLFRIQFIEEMLQASAVITVQI
jgi:hypothetical protein